MDPHSGSCNVGSKSVSRRTSQGSEGRKGSISHPTDSIEDITSNPLKCGFLLAFCESEHSAENLHYIVEIDNFRDHLLSDHSSWTNDWRLIDTMIDLHDKVRELTDLEVKAHHDDLTVVVGDESKWPSRKIKFVGSEEHIKRIWSTYLSHHAPSQICMPSRVLVNTKRRLEYLHLYGPSVFDETLLDPMKTLKVDALPRFLTSIYYKKMSKRLETIFPLPAASELSLPPPVKSAVCEWPDDMVTFEKLNDVPIIDVLHDYILFEQYVLYCKTAYIDENIFCARAISIFKSHFQSVTDMSAHSKEDAAVDAVELVWLIFRFFVAAKSPYEVSTSHRRKKQVKLLLASPKFSMFDKVEKSVMGILTNHWVHFTKSALFQELPKIIADEKKRLQTVKSINAVNMRETDSSSCFPFFR